MSKKVVGFSIVIAVAIAAAIFFFLNNGDSKQAKPISITADSVVFKRGCVSADSSCLYVSFHYPVVSGNNNKLLPILLYADYLQVLGDSSRIENSGTIRDYLSNIVSQNDSLFTEFVSAFPEGAVNTWYLKANFTTLLNDGAITCIKYYTESYMGGAHSNYSFHYFNFANQRNMTLSIGDVVSDMPLFLEKAENSFRKSQNMPQGKALDGYWFPNSTFELPAEIGFSSQGVVLHYNAYDIAPFSDGDICFVVPYGDIKELLTPEFAYLAKP